MSTGGATAIGGSSGRGGSVDTGGSTYGAGGSALATGGNAPGTGGISSATGGIAGGTGGVAGGTGGAAGNGGTTGARPSVKTLVSGQYHSCALLSDGTVKCWGYPTYAGTDNWKDPSCSGGHCPIPILVAGISDAVTIAAEDSYTCVVLAAGTVECWGLTTEGECCDLTCTGSSPTIIDGLTDAVSVAYSGEGLCGYQICVLQSGGTIQCVGRECACIDSYGKPIPEPVTMAGAPNPVSISGRCAVLADKTVTCWDYGSSTSVAIAEISDAVSVSDTCALLESGRVTCWSADSPVATAVAGVANAIALASTYDHTCVVVRGGTVKCWGSNWYGQLGDGSRIDSTTPVPVSGISSATALTVGSGNTCALLKDGSVMCWGDNLFGELGDGTTDDSAVPVTAKGL